MLLDSVATNDYILNFSQYIIT